MRSPSKHCNIAFLRYLKENNYISKTNVEYDKGEVDEMYNWIATNIGAKKAHQLYKKRYDRAGRTKILPPSIKKVE